MEYVLFGHGGSGNHGCEAIVRSTLKIFNTSKVLLYSNNYEQDIAYQVNSCEIRKSGDKLKRFSMAHFYAAFMGKLCNNYMGYANICHSDIMNSFNKNSIALSIGGDNYCYNITREFMTLLNRIASEAETKTVLWGCSIEPDIIQRIDVIRDLKRYSLITARESITYQALINSGITNTKLFPDPAFQLDKVNLSLPVGFAEKNTVGINVSPLILGYEKNKGVTMQSFRKLLQHIIDTTSMQIALIPHVVWEDSNDLAVLTELYEQFKDTGRVILIEDHNCMELKGFISRCRLFIGARTHATIAAYSTQVPTLVVGYSVKAKGIAQDIFGTYENYVIPVQTLKKEQDLINAFEWLKINENRIRNHLRVFMPSYIAKTNLAGEEVNKLVRRAYYSGC